jgi:hypothetical protein
MLTMSSPLRMPCGGTLVADIEVLAVDIDAKDGVGVDL